jgi:hypothetical protein
VSRVLSIICEDYRSSADGTVRSSWDSMTLPSVYCKALLSEQCFAYRRCELSYRATNYSRAVIRVMSVASVPISVET